MYSRLKGHILGRIPWVRLINVFFKAGVNRASGISAKACFRVSPPESRLILSIIS